MPGFASIKSKIFEKIATILSLALKTAKLISRTKSTDYAHAPSYLMGSLGHILVPRGRDADQKDRGLWGRESLGQ